MAREEENPLHGPSEGLKPAVLQLSHRQQYNSAPQKCPLNFICGTCKDIHDL